MKRLALMVCSIFFAAVTITAALAADLPRPSYKAPVYVAPGFSWSGFYVGINAGYGRGTADWITPPPASFSTTGYLAGGTLGYNLQVGSFVVGLEGDLDWANINGSDTVVCAPPNGCATKLNWLGTARGRIGYSFDRWLPFITGGVAFGGLKHTGFDASETTVKSGGALGAGIEYAFMGAWSAKLEYLYVKLGQTTCTTCFTGAPQDISYKANLVRAGLNYRF